MIFYWHFSSSRGGDDVKKVNDAIEKRKDAVETRRVGHRWDSEAGNAIEGATNNYRVSLFVLQPRLLLLLSHRQKESEDGRRYFFLLVADEKTEIQS